MRCICCNTILQRTEMLKKNPDGTFNDFCNVCLRASKDDKYEKEYTLQHLTDDLICPNGVNFRVYRE